MRGIIKQENGKIIRSVELCPDCASPLKKTLVFKGLNTGDPKTSKPKRYTQKCTNVYCGYTKAPLTHREKEIQSGFLDRELEILKPPAR